MKGRHVSKGADHSSSEQNGGAGGNLQLMSGPFEDDRITLLVGPRRAGKATLFWSRIERYGPNILWINCEEPLFRIWCQSPASFWADVQEAFGAPVVLAFDEVQHLDEAGLFLKGVADLSSGCPVLATG